MLIFLSEKNLCSNRVKGGYFLWHVSVTFFTHVVFLDFSLRYVKLLVLKSCWFLPFNEIFPSMLLRSPFVIFWADFIHTCINLYICICCPPCIFIDSYKYLHMQQNIYPIQMVLRHPQGGEGVSVESNWLGYEKKSSKGASDPVLALFISKIAPNWVNCHQCRRISSGSGSGNGRTDLPSSLSLSSWSFIFFSLRLSPHLYVIVLVVHSSLLSIL